jgi:anaerobic selenocysteine-containing dehydrogenase
MTVKAKTEIENGILSTLCRQCNMRCGVHTRIAGGRIRDISGNKDHSQCRGGICARGRAAAQLGIEDGRQLRVTSRIGSLEIQARITDKGDILPNVLQITHGWDEANVNLLTDDRLNDPVTGFPLLKAVAVKVEPVNLQS